MKIKKEHSEYMQKEIQKLIEKSGGESFVVEKYESGQFPNSGKVQDLQRRFCFDLLHASGLTSFVCNEIYSYANDTHLFTALKNICPKVIKKY